MSPDSPRLRDDAPNALPKGTRLGEFELRGVLGVGGFGIVYLAFDHQLERDVAVKEYMPESLAGRTETLQVSLRSKSDAETFALGLKSFVNEARLLARFDHPSLLKVHRFWEANGTAYMAMPVMRGRTVRETRRQMSGAPDEAWLRGLLDPLLGAIEKLHGEGVYHRDIAPDNIQIEPDGRPVLLDFGAARRVISDKTQTLTAILKPAYAPIEQYAEAAQVKQGPWTDLYALGATLHYLLLGKPPAPATARTVQDDPSELTPANCPGCSEAFLHTIDWMLAPRPQQRPQSVAALREVLGGRAPLPWVPAPAPPPVPAQPLDMERTVLLPPRSTPAAAPSPQAFVRTAPPLHDDEPTMVVPRPAPPSLSPSPSPQAASRSPLPPPPARRWPLVAGLGIAAVVAAAVALWPKAVPAPAAAPAASAPTLAAVASAPAAPPAAEPAPPAASVPESTIATVVLPGAANKPPAERGERAPARPATRPAAERPAPPAAESPVQGTPAPQSLAPAAPPAAEARPHVEPAPAGPSATAPAPATATTAAAPSGPESVCGSRKALRYFVCMERECLRGQFRDHADCVRWRKEARREDAGG